MTKCFYCDTERCNNCTIPFSSEQTLDEVYKIVESKKNYNRLFEFEFELEIKNYSDSMC